MKSGDVKGLYVETECCTSCGVPWSIAPELFADGGASCLVKRQPSGATELRRALRVLRTQDVGCIRYGGTTARVLAILDKVECSQYSDVGGFVHQRERVVGPASPPGLRAAIGLATILSVADLLGLIAYWPMIGVPGWVGAAVEVASIGFSWAALRRRSWGFWSLFGVVSFKAGVGVIASAVGEHSALMLACLFGAIGLALFPSRRW